MGLGGHFELDYPLDANLKTFSWTAKLWDGWDLRTAILLELHARLMRYYMGVGT